MVIQFYLYSVSQGNYEITKHLVERGANLNIRNNNNDTVN